MQINKELSHYYAGIFCQDLLTYNLEELYKLWDQVQHHSAERQAWINELDQQLSKVEDDRMDMVRKSFLFTAKTNLYHALGFIFTYADFAFLDEKYIQVICQDFGEDRTFDASRS